MQIPYLLHDGKVLVSLMNLIWGEAAERRGRELSLLEAVSLRKEFESIQTSLPDVFAKVRASHAVHEVTADWDYLVDGTRNAIRFSDVMCPVQTDLITYILTGMLVLQKVDNVESRVAVMCKRLEEQAKLLLPPVPVPRPSFMRRNALPICIAVAMSVIAMLTAFFFRPVDGPLMSKALVPVPAFLHTNGGPGTTESTQPPYMSNLRVEIRPWHMHVWDQCRASGERAMSSMVAVLPVPPTPVGVSFELPVALRPWADMAWERYNKLSEQMRQVMPLVEYNLRKAVLPSPTFFIDQRPWYMIVWYKCGEWVEHVADAAPVIISRLSVASDALTKLSAELQPLATSTWDRVYAWTGGVLRLLS
jgi:hypothetical protein